MEILDVTVLGITPEIKLKIIENVTISEIGRCAEYAEEYCRIHSCTNGILMNDLFTLNVMYKFSYYMCAYTFEWMPIDNISFREHLEREIKNIEDKMREMDNLEFYLG